VQGKPKSPSPKPGSEAEQPCGFEGDKVVLDMFHDGKFVYKYNQGDDSAPDGPDILKLFLGVLFGTEEQRKLRGEDYVTRIEAQLKAGGVTSLARLKELDKRGLDEMGVPVGPRAKLVEMCKDWKPPNYQDASFKLTGRWSAKPHGPTVKISFHASSESLAAYENVEVPSDAVFTLDGAFLATGACRGLNGNAPGPEAMARVYLAYITDPIEEAEVEWVRGQKRLIKEILGDRLAEMSKGADWVLAEYQAKTMPLLRDGSVYVSASAVQKSEEKMIQLKSMCDQTLAAFEEYYGNVR